MSVSRKLLAVLVAFVVPVGIFAPSANAAGEKVAAQTKITAKKGKLVKKRSKPSRLAVAAVVTPGPGATVNPTKRISIKFPAGLSLRPNKRVCTNKQLSPTSSLGSPAAITKACKHAVVGAGTAKIYLNRLKATPLSDPVLIAFNAGKTRKGQAKLKIYGYSKNTGVGILMQATLKGRVLSIAVPVLSFDSAVGEFRLRLPGGLKRADIGVNVKPTNGRYVMARCARNPLVTSAVFFMGTRNPATGQPTSGTTKVASKRSTQKCR